MSIVENGDPHFRDKLPADQPSIAQINERIKRYQACTQRHSVGDVSTSDTRPLIAPVEPSSALQPTVMSFETFAETEDVPTLNTDAEHDDDGSYSMIEPSDAAEYETSQQKVSGGGTVPHGNLQSWYETF